MDTSVRRNFYGGCIKRINKMLMEGILRKSQDLLSLHRIIGFFIGIISLQ
jgi:hypothetical protein